MDRHIILTPNNYNFLCDRVRRKIKLEPAAWAAVENGYKVPKHPLDEHGDVLPKNQTLWTDQETRDDHANTKAFDIIHDHLDMNMYQMIKNHTTAKGAWDSLRRFYHGTPEVRATNVRGLMDLFNELRMSENETCDEFFEKINRLASDLEELGEPILNKLIVDKLFLKMNSKCRPVIITLEQTDKTKTRDHEEIMTILKNFEMTYLTKPTAQTLGLVITSKIYPSEIEVVLPVLGR